MQPALNSGDTPQRSRAITRAIAGARLLILTGTIAFVGWVAWAHFAAADSATVTSALSSNLHRLALAVAGVVIATFLLAFAWASLVASAGGERDQRDRGILALVFAATWLGRYLPGKVPGLAGRVYVAHRLRFPMRPLLIGTGLMTAIELIVASLVAVVLLSVATGAVITLQPLGLIAFGAAALIAIAAATVLVLSTWQRGRRWLVQRLQELRAELREAPVPGMLLRAGTLALLSRFVSGFAFFVIVGMFAPVTWSHLALHTGAFSGAAVASMIIAVAPGGLGVREGLLVVLLAPAHGPESAGAAVILFRAVSVIADVLSLLLALACSLLLYRIPLHSVLYRDPAASRELAVAEGTQPAARERVI